MTRKQAQKPDILDFTLPELREYFTSQGLPAFRANQIHKWLYLHQADTFEQMTDVGKELRARLGEIFTLKRLDIARTDLSRDGSQKFVFRLEDGHFIESVLIPEKDHHTLCISSQVGCAQGCRFCMTAKGGFTRNLSTGEIVAQVRDIRRSMQEEAAKTPEEKEPRLSNVVFMGMGEPLANYTHVKKAIDILTDGDCGLKLSKRRITVSTAGILPRLADLGRDTQINLAISLNATENKTREALMPISRTYPLEDLLEACRRYPLAPRQKITFEYILIQGVNDSLQDARRLARCLNGIKAKINLIPFNEHPGSTFQRPVESHIHAFLKILLDKGYTAIIRWSKGEDIGAACGQLAGKAQSENPAPHPGKDETEV
ncbi:23S rRNA (adenine(2503)-C(2))-methyltransferase RlmN [Desulfobotulus sp.]|jgi:23S rRNA (adenine2503-C2)-methyltransferase|uniref:23S rRNA (adenine(2503)-C(2))-methyltransferase RlmN n=1 Tax=Desulfobotulus sp. TaxID=1940337 RepID=UPI002A371A7B|nr:23S rRNA (adenine(2503)-C(2))-methyltransferase RlmN [Desulfobotulus sp.]MDY0163117.1 23S rRNA (adenine(2503)-C(2))-methyltransferase RlmN [Desulfobotulus sp.]